MRNALGQLYKVSAQSEADKKLRLKVAKGKYVPKSVYTALTSRERMIANGDGYHWASHRSGSAELFNKMR